MRRTRKPSIRIWVLSAAVGVLSAAVMIAAAAQETPRRRDTEPQEFKAVEGYTCEKKASRPSAEQVELFGNSEPFYEDYENESIEAALLAKAQRMDNVKVTFYCTEKRKHICGTGDGLTATGMKVTAYVTVAVDPKVIPLGSTVLVDFGDGVIHYFMAEDTGGAVKGNHIDIAVEGHRQALELGTKTATVWYIK